MWRCVAIGVNLLALGGLAPVNADDKDKVVELAKLAGEYTAESSVRTGNAPAKKDALKALTLEISKDSWVQKFRGESAPYSIALDVSKNPKTIELTHLKVNAVRNCTYVLKDDTLTVTEPMGGANDVKITVWKRKPMPIN